MRLGDFPSNWGLAMDIENPPHNKRDRLVVSLRGAHNVVRNPSDCGDEFFDVLSPALEEVATFPNDGSPRQGTRNVLLLLEENARLRALAAKLSNLLGDLPVRQWSAAGR